MLESEMYKKVAEELGISTDKVEAYDKLQWRNISYDLNNPSFDILEVPFLGSFTMTYSKILATLWYELRELKRMRDSLKRKKDKGQYDVKAEIKFEAKKLTFKHLWKLRKEIYDYPYIPAYKTWKKKDI